MSSDRRPVPHSPSGQQRTLAQAGDVGTSTRGRHDTLGGAAGNVVINLSACKEQKVRVKSTLQEFLL